MKELAKRIQQRINERKYCTIFEKDVSQHWPIRCEEREKQKAEIRAFAERHGWTATILDPGIRVTFRLAAE